MAYTDDKDALLFLIDKLTNVERLISKAAYNSLSHISGKDPASYFQKEVYDIDVVLFFRDYYSKNKIEKIK